MAKVVYDSKQRRQEQRNKRRSKRYLVQEWEGPYEENWRNVTSTRWLWLAHVAGQLASNEDYLIIDTKGENDGS